jgi:hypothetical protein
MLISEMLQIHENLNIGDFNIKLPFNMKFITASLNPYNLHEGAFRSIWGSILSRLLFPKPSSSWQGIITASCLADGLCEPMDSEKLHANFVDYQLMHLAQEHRVITLAYQHGSSSQRWIAVKYFLSKLLNQKL